MSSRVHVTHANLLQPHGPVTVALVGAGGSGCQMLTGLGRLNHALRELGHPGLRAGVFDPDKVSASNVGRQLYAPSDVGLYKAIVLTHRVNAHFGTDWEAYPERYEGQGVGTRPGASFSPDLIVSCVDTAASRRGIHNLLVGGKAGYWRSTLYWLDLGNRSRDGQVILGQPPSAVATRDRERTRCGQLKPILRLPMVTELFPELLDESLPEDDRPSCSLAEALDHQDLYINQAVVTWALHLLWSLFRDGQIGVHGYFVNLAEGRVNPLAVPDRPLPANRRARKRARREAAAPAAAGA
ncbi:MAG TPA: PRTRC system ThiF family protein [Armatimonadota bacterium]|jgi:PRTRC genetic system ThiF family protein